MRARPVTASADSRSARAQAQAQAQALREELKAGNAFALLNSQTLRAVAAGGAGSLSATATASAMAASAIAASAGSGAGGTGFFGLGGSLPGLASTLAAATAPFGASAAATALRPGSAAARTQTLGRHSLGETAAAPAHTHAHAAPAGASEPLAGVSEALLTHAEVAARAARREWPAVLFRPLAALLSSVGATEMELAEWLAHPARGLAFPSARDVDEVDAREAARARREEEEARAGEE